MINSSQITSLKNSLEQMLVKLSFPLAPQYSPMLNHPCVFLIPESKIAQYYCSHCLPMSSYYLVGFNPTTSNQTHIQFIVPKDSSCRFIPYQKIIKNTTLQNSITQLSLMQMVDKLSLLNVTFE